MKRPFSKQKVNPKPYNFPSINLCNLKSETKKNDKSIIYILIFNNLKYN